MWRRTKIINVVSPRRIGYVMYWTGAVSRPSDANLWADESTSNTTPTFPYSSHQCVTRGLSVSETSTRVLQKYMPVLLRILIGLLASVIAIRQLLLISGDVEQNPGPLGQGEIINNINAEILTTL